MSHLSIVGFFAIFYLSIASAKNYDYIITGASGAGSLLAYRLSENKKNKVLLIERGDDVCDVLSDAVGFWNSVFTLPPEEIPDIASRSIYDRHWYTREINTQSVYVPVPTMLGGGVLRNGNAFGRMSSEEMAGFNSPLWTFNATTQDWKDIFTYNQCIESTCDTNAHGTSGPLLVDSFGLDSNLVNVNSVFQQQFGLQWDDDLNDGTNNALGLMHRNIKVVDGTPVRQEPFCNLLKGVIDDRKNLDVISGAVVTRIDLRNNGKHRVEYIYQGESHRDRATKEVIVSAGAIESAQLLKLSGIGPCDELESFDIECQYNNPHVGEELLDNPTIGIVYGTPPLSSSSPGSILVGYLKTDPAQPYPDFEVAASTVSTSPFFSAVLTYVSDFEHGGIGRVLLKSSDPLKSPIISTNFFTTTPDRISRLRDKVKAIRTGLQGFNNLIGAPFFNQISPSLEVLPLNATDADIDSYLLGSDGISASWHWTGSTQMHKVVDDRLRVIDGHGNVIHGLRVAGNGVCPNNLKSHSTGSFSIHVGQILSRFLAEEYE